MAFMSRKSRSPVRSSVKPPAPTPVYDDAREAIRAPAATSFDDYDADKVIADVEALVEADGKIAIEPPPVDQQFDVGEIDSSSSGSPWSDSEITPPVAEEDLPTTAEALREIERAIEDGTLPFPEASAEPEPPTLLELAEQALVALRAEYEQHIATLRIELDQREERISIEVMRYFDSETARRDAFAEAQQLSEKLIEVEQSLLSSRLRVSEVEFDMGLLRANQARLESKQLWLVMPRAGTKAAARIYVLAANSTEASERAVKAGLVSADDISNVTRTIEKIVF